MPDEHNPPTMAEVLLWKARARQSQAETRAAKLERDHWRRLARKWEKRAKGNSEKIAQLTEGDNHV